MVLSALHVNVPIAGLVLPPLSVIMPVQILRSTLFLLASLSSLILWRGRRGALVAALGLAHRFLFGAFGLLQSSFLSQVLRIAHTHSKLPPICWCARWR
jgi:hypothetical protein